MSQWKVMGTSLPRPNRPRHRHRGPSNMPSDIVRPGMLYGKVLRPPSYGATLTDIDLAPAKALEGVVGRARRGVCRLCGPDLVPGRTGGGGHRRNGHLANRKPSFQQGVVHVSEGARSIGTRRRRKGPAGGASEGDVSEALTGAKTVLSQNYEVAYIQHTPLEPRAGTGRVERREVDRLGGHVRSLRRAQRTGPRFASARGSGAGDRARRWRRLRRQAPGRGRRRGRAAG